MKRQTHDNITTTYHWKGNRDCIFHDVHFSRLFDNLSVDDVLKVNPKGINQLRASDVNCFLSARRLEELFEIWFFASLKHSDFRAKNILYLLLFHSADHWALTFDLSLLLHFIVERKILFFKVCFVERLILLNICASQIHR